MKKIVFFIILNLNYIANAQQVEWVKNFDNAAVAGNYLYYLGKASTGDTYTAGEFRGSVKIDNYAFYNPGPGSKSYIVKQKKDGSFYWGFSYPFRITSLLINNADEALISGDGVFASTNDNYFIAKVNQQGNIVWLKTLAYPAWFKTIDMNGDAMVAGNFFDSLQIDTFKLYAICNWCLTQYIAKINQNGNFNWAKVFNISAHASLYGLVTDQNNNFYLNSNSFISKFDYQGNIIWTKYFIGGVASGGLKKDPVGNIYAPYWFRDSIVIGNTTVYDEYCFNINSCGKSALIKLDTAGNVQWFKTVSVKGTGDYLKFTVNAIGNVFIAGNVSDTVWVCDTTLISLRPDIATYQQNEMFIAKLNGAGKLIWNLRFIANNANQILDMVSNNQSVNIIGWFFGDYLLGGADSLLSDGNCKIYTAQIKDTSMVVGIPIINFGSSHANSNSVSIFPNPISESFTIKLDKPSNAKICVYDVLGNCAYTSTMENSEEKIDMSKQTKGIYFVKVNGSNSSNTFKIIKE